MFISLLRNIQDDDWDEYKQFQATKILFELGEIDQADFQQLYLIFCLNFVMDLL
jgi:hypothetical protein